jgi:hypothetical protein
MEELEGAELWTVMMGPKEVAGASDDERRKAALGLSLVQVKAPGFGALMEPGSSLLAFDQEKEVQSIFPASELLRSFHSLARLFGPPPGELSIILTITMCFYSCPKDSFLPVTPQFVGAGAVGAIVPPL